MLTKSYTIIYFGGVMWRMLL